MSQAAVQRPREASPGTPSDWKPNFFLPGFPKCGTTALAAYVAQHPDVFMLGQKEPNTLAYGEELPRWWGRRIGPWRSSYVGPEAYRREFVAHASCPVRGEASQSYSLCARSPAALKSFAPGARLLFCVRDQRERLLSLFFFSFPNHLEPDFQRWLRRVFVPDLDRFLFVPALRAYRRLYGEQMRVVQAESLRSAPGRTMDAAFSFLGLRPVAVTPLARNAVPRPDLAERRASLARATIVNRLVDRPRVLMNAVCPRLSSPLQARLAAWRRVGVARAQPGAVEEIPDPIGRVLDADYREALAFCRDGGLLL